MSIVKKYIDNVLYYELEGFNQGDEMSHLFSTRLGWNQEKLFEDLSHILNIPLDNIFSGKQVHGTEIAVIDHLDKIDIGEKDGLITNLKGVVLSTYHADCVPIYYYDSDKAVIGMAHAGWKGTLNNINQSIIEKMTELYGSNPYNIKVGIGPSIGPCCYEIGHDVMDLFKDKYPENGDIFTLKEEKIYLDLWKVNEKNLLNLGIKKENIYLSEECTSCNVDKLYSYRRESGTKNRMIGAITLNP